MLKKKKENINSINEENINTIKEENIFSQNSEKINWNEIPYVIQKCLLLENIEEIDINSKKIKSLSKNKKIEELSKENQVEIDAFINRIIWGKDKALNITTPFLDLDYDILVDKDRFNNYSKDVIDKLNAIKLRINIISKDVAQEEYNLLNIRVNNTMKHLTDKEIRTLFEDNNNGEVAFDKLKKLINLNSKPNILVSGETGSGKTEFQKYIINQIPTTQKIVILQDTRDAALKNLYPEKDIIELYIDNASFPFESGIKASLRNNPDWLMISEIRGSEAGAYFKALQSGHSGISTIHAKDAKTTIKRLAEEVSNVYGKSSNPELIEKQCLELIDYVIHLKKIYYIKNEKVYSKRVINEFANIKDGNLNLIYSYKEVDNNEL